MNDQEFLKKYNEFLDEMTDRSKGHLICDQCGLEQGHPINYCPKCPGKIQRVKMTWREYKPVFDRRFRTDNECQEVLIFFDQMGGGLMDYSFRKWLGRPATQPLNQHELSLLKEFWRVKDV